MEKQRYYKFTDYRGLPIHGRGVYSLPQRDGNKWIPGDWMPLIKDELEICARGYHMILAKHIIPWMGPRMFEVEPGEEHYYHYGHEMMISRTVRFLREVENWNSIVLLNYSLWFINYNCDNFLEEDPDASAVVADILNGVPIEYSYKQSILARSKADIANWDIWYALYRLTTERAENAITKIYWEILCERGYSKELACRDRLIEVLGV